MATLKEGGAAIVDHGASGPYATSPAQNPCEAGIRPSQAGRRFVGLVPLTRSESCENNHGRLPALVFGFGFDLLRGLVSWKVEG